MPHTRSSRRKKATPGGVASGGGGDGQGVPPTKRPKVRRRHRRRGRRNAAAADAPSSHAGTVVSGGGASIGGAGGRKRAGHDGASPHAGAPASASTAAGSICDDAVHAPSPRAGSRAEGGSAPRPPAQPRAKGAAATELGTVDRYGSKDAQDGGAAGGLPLSPSDGVPADGALTPRHAGPAHVEGSATAEAAARLQGAACRLREARTAAAAATDACDRAREAYARLVFVLDSQRAAAEAEQAERSASGAGGGVGITASGRPIVRARDRAVQVAAAAVARQAEVVSASEAATEAAERALRVAQEEANAAFYAVGAAMAVENGCVGHATRTQTFSGSGTASVSGGADGASAGDTRTSRPASIGAGSYALADGDSDGADDAGAGDDGRSVLEQAGAGAGLHPDFDFEDPPHNDSRTPSPEPAAPEAEGGDANSAGHDGEARVPPSPSASTRASDPAAGSVVSREPAHSHGSVPPSPAAYAGAAPHGSHMMPPPMVLQWHQQQQHAAAAWHADMMRAQHAHAHAVRQGLVAPGPFVGYPRGGMGPPLGAFGHQGAMPPSPPGPPAMHPHMRHPMARGAPMVMMAMPQHVSPPHAGIPPQFQFRQPYPHPSFMSPPQRPRGAQRDAEGTDTAAAVVDAATRGVGQLTMNGAEPAHPGGQEGGQ